MIIDRESDRQAISRADASGQLRLSDVGVGGRVKGDRRALLRSIGVIRSTLKKRRDAPKQGAEGAPDAWLEVSPFAIEGLHRLSAGSDVIILTWLNQARRDVLKVYPRSDRRNPLTGVFATRSPDRPNPIGLHRVTIHAPPARSAAMASDVSSCDCGGEALRHRRGYYQGSARHVDGA